MGQGQAVEVALFFASCLPRKSVTLTWQHQLPTKPGPLRCPFSSRIPRLPLGTLAHSHSLRFSPGALKSLRSQVVLPLCEAAMPMASAAGQTAPL